MSESSESEVVKARYKDGYLVARTTTSFGDIIKNLGIVLGVVICLATLFAAANLGHDAGRGSTLLPVAGIIQGCIVGVIVYGFGIVVSALGQIQKSSLDCAVNSSPFLSNEQRIEAMDLPANVVNNNAVVYRAPNGRIGIEFTKQFVLAVRPGSPADFAGIMVGDKILSVDGQMLHGDPTHDGELVGGEPGTSLTLRVWRNGKQQDFTLIRE